MLHPSSITIPGVFLVMFKLRSFSRRWVLTAFFFVLQFGFLSEHSGRADMNMTGQFTGSWVAVNPSALGGELGASLLVQPDPNRAFWLGPRIGGLWAMSSAENRFDLQWGGEGFLWLLNAIGMGFEV